jgi:hypothetical protein
VSKLNYSLFAGLAVLALPCASALATVSLVFNQTAVTIDRVLNPNPTFTFSVFLTSSGEQTLGLDYFLGDKGLLGVPSPVARFDIVDRTITGTPFTDPLNDDGKVEGSAMSDETEPTSVDDQLDPKNFWDLGATTNAGQPTNAGSFKVADYTLRYIGNTNGQFIIETVDATYAAPDFSDPGFTTQGSITVNVIPEPGTLALAGIAGAALVLRRRRARVVV